MIDVWINLCSFAFEICNDYFELNWFTTVVKHKTSDFDDLDILLWKSKTIIATYNKNESVNLIIQCLSIGMSLNTQTVNNNYMHCSRLLKCLDGCLNYITCHLRYDLGFEKEKYWNHYLFFGTSNVKR